MSGLRGRFRVKQVSSTTGIRCPKCDRKFRYSQGVLATPQTTKKASNLVEAKPVKPKVKKHATSDSTAIDSATHHKQNRKQKSKLVAPSTTTAPPKQAYKTEPVASHSKVATEQHSTEALPSQPSETIDVGENSASKMTLIQARKRQKARQQTSRAITSIVVLLIATAVLGYFLYRQLNYTPPVEPIAGNTKALASKKEPIDLSNFCLLYTSPSPRDRG